MNVHTIYTQTWWISHTLKIWTGGVVLMAWGILVGLTYRKSTLSCAGTLTCSAALDVSQPSSLTLTRYADEHVLFLQDVPSEYHHSFASINVSVLALRDNQYRKMIIWKWIMTRMIDIRDDIIHVLSFREISGMLIIKLVLHEEIKSPPHPPERRCTVFCSEYRHSPFTRAEKHPSVFTIDFAYFTIFTLFSFSW